MSTRFTPPFNGIAPAAGLLLLGLLSACTHQLGPAEYVRWVESYEHPLHVKQTSGEYTVDVQYKPAAYQRLQRDGLRPVSTAANAVTASAPEPDGMQYFSVTLGLVDKKQDFMAYQVTTDAGQHEKLYYFSYSFQDDLQLEVDGARYPCVLYHFERSYDLKPTRTFVLGFDAPIKLTASCRVLISSAWLSPQPLRISIDRQSIPSLSLR